LLFTGGSSNQGGKPRKTVAKQPRSRPHRDILLEKEDGTYTTRDTERMNKEAAIHADAKE
jgi:hypothetical protein